jgi:phosphatidylserine/phosphatidylglycerophosphate/cardiolipin synthase-like enzyme
MIYGIANRISFASNSNMTLIEPRLSAPKLPWPYHEKNRYRASRSRRSQRTGRASARKHYFTRRRHRRYRTHSTLTEYWHGARQQHFRGLDRWLAPRTRGIDVNVNWIYTKFMLIDPLGNKPVTLTGSANFSEASMNTNDENMLLIRGDRRMADIYFGEFMRVFAHHRFREPVKRHIEQFGSAAFNTWRPQDLFEDWKKWAPMHFKKNSEHGIKRRYFVGN